MKELGKAGKFKIYQDELKLRHTTHWDLDYLGAEDFEAVMKGGKAMPQAPHPTPVAPPATTGLGWLASLVARFGRR